MDLRCHIDTKTLFLEYKDARLKLCILTCFVGCVPQHTHTHNHYTHIKILPYSTRYNVLSIVPPLPKNNPYSTHYKILSMFHPLQNNFRITFAIAFCVNPVHFELPLPLTSFPSLPSPRFTSFPSLHFVRFSIAKVPNPPSPLLPWMLMDRY